MSSPKDPNARNEWLTHHGIPPRAPETTPKSTSGSGPQSFQYDDPASHTSRPAATQRADGGQTGTGGAGRGGLFWLLVLGAVAVCGLAMFAIPLLSLMSPSQDPGPGSGPEPVATHYIAPQWQHTWSGRVSGVNSPVYNRSLTLTVACEGGCEYAAGGKVAGTAEDSSGCRYEFILDDAGPRSLAGHWRNLHGTDCMPTSDRIELWFWEPDLQIMFYQRSLLLGDGRLQRRPGSTAATGTSFGRPRVLGTYL